MNKRTIRNQRQMPDIQQKVEWGEWVERVSPLSFIPWGLADATGWGCGSVIFIPSTWRYLFTNSCASCDDYCGYASTVSIIISALEEFICKWPFLRYEFALTWREPWIFWDGCRTFSESVTRAILDWIPGDTYFLQRIFPGVVVHFLLSEYVLIQYVEMH